MFVNAWIYFFKSSTLFFASPPGGDDDDEEDNEDGVVFDDIPVFLSLSLSYKRGKKLKAK